MRRTVKVYLKSGQIIKLRGVEEFEFSRSHNGGSTIRWKVKTRGYKPLAIDPDEIAAVIHR